MSAAESFNRTALAKFLSSTAGRAFRVVVGAALAGYGYSQGSTVLMVVGLVPLAAGAFNLCLISALLGGPIRGGTPS
jgi:hypothetical protein